MAHKPTYEELEKRIRALEKERASFLQKGKTQLGNESSFSQLFQWAPIPMAYATEKDGYEGTIWNVAWYCTFGYPKDLAQGCNGNDIGLWVRSEDRSRLIEMANQNNYVTDFETVLRCHDGSFRNCSLFGRFIKNPGNRLLMVVYHDITARKTAEHSLRESETRFKALHNASFGGIGIHDKGIILECNQGLSDMTGYSVDELIGMNGLLLIAEQSRPMVMDKILYGYEKPYEAIGLRKNGSEFPMRLEARNIPYRGKNVRTVEFRDLTEQKKAEQDREILQNQLNQAQKMESVGRLAAGTAHEINNSLAGVIQNTSVLENRLTNQTMPANIKVAQSIDTTMDTISEFMEKREIPHILGNIKESGIRMATIVENMLSFARKPDSTFSTHDPVVLMDKVLELASTGYDLKKHYDFKSISIEKEYENNLPMVVCEGSKIQQVILNILNNGAYEMFETPKDVPPKFILRLNQDRASNMLKIEIEDNGPGMDTDTAKRIFEPFFTTKPVGGGTGLGLSVSYFIITENHNGSMEVISELGIGSTFIIRLPVAMKLGV